MLKYLFYLLVLYIFLHNPHAPLISIGLIKILYLPLFYILLKYRKSFADYCRLFNKELKVLMAAIAFVLFRSAIGGDVSMISIHIFGIIEIFLLPLALIIYTQKIGLDKTDKFIRALLCIGAIGAVISTIAIFFPSVQNVINNTFGSLSSDSFLARSLWRGRGLSEALTSDYSYIQASLVILFCFYFKKNKWFFLFIPLMLLSIIFNARTGIIILIGGGLLYLFYKLNPSKIILSIIVSTFAFYIFLYFFSRISNTEDVVAFLLDFSEQIESVYQSGDVGNARTMKELFVDFWIMPSNQEEWIIGRGFRLFGMKDILGYSSDVGFINYLLYGGIFYVCIIVSFYFVVLKRLFNNKEKWYFVFFLITLIVITIKSIPFPNSGETRFLMLVYYFIIVEERKYFLFDRKRLYMKKTFINRN